MMKLLGALALSVALVSCATEIAQDETPVTASDAHITGAVSDPVRPAADVERDALRHPADILAFAGVRPGDRVVDVGTGGGYYTRLFSRAVGPNGSVVGINRPPRPDATAPPAINAVLENPAYANVSVQANGYVFTLDPPADIIFISQIYHDFHLPQLAIDVPALNRGLFQSLRPGGTLVIIDHSAAPGAAEDSPFTIHRIDEARVRRELEAAGFVFEAASEVLRNPADDRSIRVFEGAVRGHTDQFALRFRRP